MTRLYLKVFFTFWLITAMIIVATNVLVHWFDLAPDTKMHKTSYDKDYAPARRLLFQMVGSAINRNTEELIQDMRAMPGWSTQYFYIVDEQGEDLLDRPVPQGVQALIPELTSIKPYGRHIEGHQKIYGRYLSLNDGRKIKVITVSSTHDDPSEADIMWQLFISNIWPLLLVSILICGVACYFLARHFSRSVATLQKATKQIANGDLSVRVSPHFAGRRDEIASLGRDFDHMTERLEKAMLEQKRLIKDVSHELRSPLARLQVALGIAQQRSNGSVDKELDRIKKAADYLGDVISDILALPVHDNGGWELDDTLDLRALLETLMENYGAEARRKGVALVLESDLEEALVPTHGNMLVGVFENILRNALHYTDPATTVSLSLSADAAQKPDDPHYCVRVCDQGPGVPAESLSDIFQPFYRTDEDRNRESGGYGLGLAIAQRSVALHQGTIDAQNQPEGGLCVRVCLPAVSES
ncbi:ATP-binding protein [Marinimicrobium sp. LS-A18]|uniref:ATP-binding protein n=1 Tax=Marinimicrobium sp. LS-A18 TaxID=1381596 RepID=UPI0004634D11|nr:ATP-binding protein [Marinimicrobium sp. LS-A18]